MLMAGMVMEKLRIASAIFIVSVFAALIFWLGTTSNRVSDYLFDATPTPAICAHQEVVINKDNDYSYFAVTEKACIP